MWDPLFQPPTKNKKINKEVWALPLSSSTVLALSKETPRGLQSRRIYLSCGLSISLSLLYACTLRRRIHTTTNTFLVRVYVHEWGGEMRNFGSGRFWLCLIFYGTVQRVRVSSDKKSWGVSWSVCSCLGVWLYASSKLSLSFGFCLVRFRALVAYPGFASVFFLDLIFITALFTTKRIYRMYKNNFIHIL